MAATQKLYPRGTVKRIVKAHSNRSVSKNADILVRRNPVALQRYPMANQRVWVIDLFGLHAVYARADARGFDPFAQVRREKNISANTVRKVTEKTLRKFQG
ncbi:transcriptional regulator family: Histone-like TF [Penicillium alfredii]|uniref:Transcriptional regulator family: Histone-like TF n=1 Tax=Penicillium alfredii TaxID=1506179 RepID=A0A9W9FRR2_9EURO|nr:transcriptional regulator family: Histone-like TF [Penicillium alfredii]KAJ5105188.1 transcriptional regulator family: Histone-like TF [Penicillium alfredii]